MMEFNELQVGDVFTVRDAPKERPLDVRTLQVESPLDYDREFRCQDNANSRFEYLGQPMANHKDWRPSERTAERWIAERQQRGERHKLISAIRLFENDPEVISLSHRGEAQDLVVIRPSCIKKKYFEVTRLLELDWLKVRWLAFIIREEEIVGATELSLPFLMSSRHAVTSTGATHLEEAIEKYQKRHAPLQVWHPYLSDHEY